MTVAIDGYITRLVITTVETPGDNYIYLTVYSGQDELLRVVCPPDSALAAASDLLSAALRHIVLSKSMRHNDA